jgi:tyrosyl-tRNA synthetase
MPDDEIESVRTAATAGGSGAMELKKRLGVEMVAWFHSPEAAEAARVEFEHVVQGGEEPEEVPEFVVNEGADGVSAVDDDGFTADLSRLLPAAGLTASRGEAHRLLRQNAVEVDGARASADAMRIAWGALVRAGRRRYVRIVRG